MTHEQFEHRKALLAQLTTLIREGIPYASGMEDTMFFFRLTEIVDMEVDRIEELTNER